ncbi:serine-rich adhesin for platelets [Anabrus simplex]|uniref:serine-rich adhesin for platelets n=1 Tax=Anabrus simplex TaxID=316456 RepID=UPI0035A2A060
MVTERVGRVNASGGANKTNGGNSGQQTAGGAASVGAAKHQQQSQQQQQQQQDPKPVECNLCHRKFKNTPALNGHMRLHGGYFKKDSESKKCEKKEVSGPPLQTASMSVRALIEEKIIQKRITNPQHGNSAQQSASAQSVQLAYSNSESTSGTRTTAPPPQYTSPGSGNSVKESDMNIKLSSFVVPAPPAQSNNSSEKLRRHSDSEHFVPPRVPATGDVQEAVALAELLLKRGGKVSVKRASSDPGPQQLQLSFQAQPDGYSLAGVGVTYQAEDGGYFSPNLQEDVFQQVSVQDTMLLHGVDPAQLAESIQFQAASLLQDQATAEQLQDIASLEDYQNATGLPHSPGVGQYHSQNHTSVHQDFQAVLNSPLPVSLADFTAYGHQTIVTSTGGIHSSLSSPIPKDLSSGYQATHSPLQSQSKDYVSYTSSPLAVQSPLPSPLTHHDSPSFTYPTPPASQEGQSPSFGHSTLVTSALPLASPHAAQQNTDNFVQSVIAHGGHVPPVSSPLSAAFYTTTMSSSAAVEEALSEVLPVETLGQQGSCMGSGHMRSHGLGLYHPSPPPQSPLSATPVPSPLSMSSVPASSSSVSSPLPPTAFTPTQGQVSFPLSPHHTLQSQMMPNSEDPLLSSSPKDFGSRKKFDFGSTHSFKLIGNGTVDLGLANSGLTGIVVDSNGELKFLQATNHHHHHHHHHHHSSHGDHHQHQSKGIVVSSSGSVGGGNNTNLAVIGSGGAFHRKTEAAMQRMVPKPASVGSSSTQYMNSSGTSYRSQRPKLQVALDGLKEEVDDDVFLSPTSIPASPIRSTRKKSRPEPLYILPNAHPTYQSRLRTPRTSEDSSTSPPPLYTPPPMLSPSRNGQGLFWQTTMSSSSGPHSSSTWPSSTCKNGSGGESSSDESQQGPNSGSNSTIESDTTPHINVGPAFQCTVPQWNPDREKANREPSYEHLLWDPGISKVCSDSEVEMYLEFACCAAVPGGGRNKEYALHLLHMCRGNIHEAMLKLMQPTPALPPGHPLLAYQYCESDRWSADEMDTFHQGLLKYDKDFRSISQEIGSKTIKQCVQFYYVWKKVCPEEYKRLRLLRRRQNVDDSGRLEMEFDDIKTEDSRHSIPANDVELVSTSSESRLFICEYPDCSASFNSRAALNGHIRIHGGGVCGRSPTPDKRPATATPPTLGDILEEFPCKICGKVFNKVKSRSAHMKSHRPPDAEPKKPKLDPHKMEAAEQTLGRAVGVTTTISTTTRHA